MEERFRVLKESGYDTVKLTVAILEQNGYTIKQIEEGMVPFCEGADGQPVLVRGWSIVAERPKPEQTSPAFNQDTAYPTPWLWK